LPRTKDKEALIEAAILEKVIATLEKGESARTLDFDEEEEKYVSNNYSC